MTTTQAEEARVASLTLETERAIFRQELTQMQSDKVNSQASFQQQVTSLNAEADKLRQEVTAKNVRISALEGELEAAHLQRLEAMKDADLKLQRTRMKVHISSKAGDITVSDKNAVLCVCEQV